MLKGKMRPAQDADVTGQTYPPAKHTLGYVWRVPQMIGIIYMSTKVVILVCGNLHISQP